MSLTARQQRALDAIESALCAGDPDLVGMFAVFDRLNAGEPVTAEPQARQPRRQSRWPVPRPALSAFVLVPLAFALIVIGAVFGGARSVKTCVVAPFGSRPVCQVHRPAATAKSAKKITTTAGSVHAEAPAWPPP
jgi:hypothetical protein